MLFPVIRVYDKETGYSHIVGTTTHDKLTIQNGQLSYYNLQNGEGSGKNGSYQFECIEQDVFEEVEFVTMDELQTIYAAECAKEEQVQKEQEKMIDMLVKDF